MSKCKYGMQKPVQNVLQQCINGFKRMKKGGIGVANECVQQACEMALKYINELEAKLAYSKPVKRGFWKPISESKMTGFNPKFAGRDPIAGYKCSNCGNEAIFSCNDEFVLSDYCPNCGTEMNGDGSDG